MEADKSQGLLNFKKEVVKFFLEKNILISPELLEKLKKEDNLENLISLIIDNVSSEDFDMIKEDLPSLLEKCDLQDIDLNEIDTNTNVAEEINTEIPIDDNKASFSPLEDRPDRKVRIVRSYNKPQSKKEVKDFVRYLNNRFRGIERILSSRKELSGLLSIGRILQKKERDVVSLIGMVTEKNVTKNGNLMLTLEDPTGEIKVLVNKNKSELYEECLDITLDEILGVKGTADGKIVFADIVIWPDIPNTKELRKSPDEVYAAFVSDWHVGSKEFLEEDMLKFIAWTKGEVGNETQKRIAKKLKYIVIAGDLIAGVGIYPGQESDLVIPDVYEQYKECARLMKMIPEHITLIIAPGNHDAVRMSEPQPVLDPDFAAPIYELPNAVLISNPGIVNIHGDEDFPGFDILVYHGYSFHYYCQEIESIRSAGGNTKPDIVMKYLLKRRHLAPSHKSTLYIPDLQEDPLIINHIPDIFVCGHIHKCAVAGYKNITMICGSCFEDKTSFQEKLGFEPEPSKIPVINLQTRNVKIMKFSSA